jgi:hypothetical protein
VQVDAQLVPATAVKPVVHVAVHLLPLALSEQVQAVFAGMAGLVVLGLPVQAAQQEGQSSIPFRFEAHATLVSCNAQQAELHRLHQTTHLVLLQKQSQLMLDQQALAACRSSSQPHVPAPITHSQACRLGCDQIHLQQGCPRCQPCKLRPSWWQAEQCSRWCMWQCTCCRWLCQSRSRLSSWEWLGWSCWGCQCKLHSRREQAVW